MNVKRFTARTSRDALNLVRQALGDDAVVLSTRPCTDGVEVLAMAPDGVEQIERLAAPSVAARKAATSNVQPARPARADTVRAGLLAAARSAMGAMPGAHKAASRAADARDTVASAPTLNDEVANDVEQLAMSTLSFQDYVRERMLKRRQAAMLESAASTAIALDDEPDNNHGAVPDLAEAARPMPSPIDVPVRAAAPSRPTAQRGSLPRLSDAVEPSSAGYAGLADHVSGDGTQSRRDQFDVMNELRSMKGLIEERFGALAFMEKLQREPRQALLTQKLLDSGFSPALTRKLIDGLPATGDETAWAASVLERNLLTGEAEPALEEAGGVFALIGSTGVGKTTSTAKIAAAFAARHGASHLGLITLDAYRVGAHEQLRAYGRILGAPVHTAHDRASLEDLLELLSSKKMVLIDTAGMAQRDSRTRELLDMLAHRSIQKLLVVDASAQGETIDDVIVSWRAVLCKGVVLSKIDEAVKLAPALDALIRHKLKVVGVANGQRVPEDWHRLSAHALVHRAMRASSTAAYRMEPHEVQLVFAAPGAAHLVSHTAAAMHA